MNINIIPCLNDNYSYLIHDEHSNTVAIIDPSEFEPCDKIINKNNPFIIEYDCIICNKRNIFRLNNIVRKINRNIKRCIQCVNYCPDKIINQRNTLFDTFEKKNDNNIIYININIIVKWCCTFFNPIFQTLMIILYMEPLN